MSKFQIGSAPIVERRVDVSTSLRQGITERRAEMQDTLNRAAAKAKERQYSGAPITGWPDLSDAPEWWVRL